MKQYILDRHTTPGTPVMDQVPTEKIPIYDSQQDAESDLANLAEGQIVGTKEGKFDVDTMKQYIRNQNVLDDANDFSVIQNAISSANKVEMPYDGILYYTTEYNKNRTFYFVNADSTNMYVTVSMNSNDMTGVGGSIPFKKGWYFYTNHSGTGSAWVTNQAYIHFYKLRDYSDR